MPGKAKVMKLSSKNINNMENNIFVKYLVDRKWNQKNPMLYLCPNNSQIEIFFDNSNQIEIYKDELRIKTIYLNNIEDLKEVLRDLEKL